MNLKSVFACVMLGLLLAACGSKNAPPCANANFLGSWVGVDTPETWTFNADCSGSIDRRGLSFAFKMRDNDLGGISVDYVTGETVSLESSYCGSVVYHGTSTTDYHGPASAQTRMAMNCRPHADLVYFTKQ